jgi:hypothetical protein
MNKGLLLETLKKNQVVRKLLKGENNQDSLKNSSRVLFFAGEEFNQELSQNQEKINLIDFSEAGNKKGE